MEEYRIIENLQQDAGDGQETQRVHMERPNNMLTVHCQYFPPL